MTQEDKEQECKKCGRVFGSVKCFDVDCPNNTPKITMNQEEKDLLIKDLCARLPYEVKVQYEDGIFTIDYISAMYEEVKLNTPNNYTIDILDIKPYLFPLSSMTEEQKEELNRVTNGKFNSYGTYIDNCKLRNWNEWGTTEYNWVRHQDVDLLNMWLNKNHFDYRGLIEKGLAIDATGKDIY